MSPTGGGRHGEANLDPVIDQLRAWAPAAAWAGALFLVSAWPSAGDVSLPFSDKLAHVGVYAVLGATLAHGRRQSGPGAPHWLLIVLGALYGASDEWHQSFVPGRDVSLGDWVSDVVGVVLGYGFALALWNRGDAVREAVREIEEHPTETT